METGKSSMNIGSSCYEQRQPRHPISCSLRYHQPFRLVKLMHKYLLCAQQLLHVHSWECKYNDRGSQVWGCDQDSFSAILNNYFTSLLNSFSSWDSNKRGKETVYWSPFPAKHWGSFRSWEKAQPRRAVPALLGLHPAFMRERCLGDSLIIFMPHSSHKIILTRTETAEHHWAAKETLSNPHDLAEIIVGDGLSPGVGVIMITAVTASLIFPKKIRNCFFPSLGNCPLCLSKLHPQHSPGFYRFLIPSSQGISTSSIFCLLGNAPPPYFKGESKELCKCPSLSPSHIISHSLHFLSSKEKDWRGGKACYDLCKARKWPEET